MKMLFGMLTWVNPKKHVLDGMHIGRHLANTSEPSTYGGNAALCQIALTICFYITCQYGTFLGTYSVFTFQSKDILFLHKETRTSFLTMSRLASFILGGDWHKKFRVMPTGRILYE